MNNERLRSRGSKAFSRRSELPSFGVPGVPGVTGVPGTELFGESKRVGAFHMGDVKYEGSGSRGESAMIETKKLRRIEGRSVVAEGKTR